MTKCLACRRGNLKLFLDLGQQPLANKYPATKQEFENEDFFPLQVFFCPRCQNIQLGTIVSRDRMFIDYYYLSSVNPGLVRHFKQLAADLAGANFVVDIGSNDGVLLKPLQERGIKAVGVDPSINVSKVAHDAGLTTIVSFFTTQAANTIKREYGQPDVIIASSVFTHVRDPHEFIEAVQLLMADDGKLIIEVEYIGNIIKKIQFERFYLDRVFYFSLQSLNHLFTAHNMSIIDAQEIEPHGGSIRVIVKKGRASASRQARRFLSKERTILNPTRLARFTNNVEEGITAFRNKLMDCKATGIKVAGYGAPARLATICNYGKIGPELIDYVVDDSPLKQGRFTPGTHIPIVGVDHLHRHQPDYLVVFAYEYLDDIKKKIIGNFQYWMPVPPLEVT